jgi:hypothetical protein
MMAPSVRGNLVTLVKYVPDAFNVLLVIDTAIYNGLVK